MWAQAKSSLQSVFVKVFLEYSHTYLVVTNGYVQHRAEHLQQSLQYGMQSLKYVLSSPLKEKSANSYCGIITATQS